MSLRVLLLLFYSWRTIRGCGVNAGFSGIAYDQRPGIQLPIQDMFRDDTDRMVRLADLFEGKPLVLALGYFHCPNLCSVVRADLFDALCASGMTAGRDYSLVALSIDPSETSADAAAAKAEDLQRYPAPGAAQNWHFLTGTFDAVQAVANAVGFHERFDPELKHSRIQSASSSHAHWRRVELSSWRRLPGRRRAARRDPGCIGKHRGCGAAGAVAVLRLQSGDGRYTLAIMKLLRLARRSR